MLHCFLFISADLQNRLFHSGNFCVDSTTLSYECQNRTAKKCCRDFRDYGKCSPKLSQCVKVDVHSMRFLNVFLSNFLRFFFPSIVVRKFSSA